MFFVRIIQGAGAFLWLALDAFNRQRNAHYRRDTHRIGTASRGDDSRRNLTPSDPPPTVHQPIQFDQCPQVVERDEFHHRGMTRATARAVTSSNGAGDVPTLTQRFEH